MQSLLQRLLLGNAGGGGGGNPTLNYNFVDGSAFPSAITFSRGTNATQFDSSGNLVYAPANLALYSEQFNDVTWTKTGSSITSNSTTAPNSTLTADTVTEDSSTGQHLVGISAAGGVLVGQVFTLSCFVKVATGTRNVFLTAFGEGYSVFNPSTGAIIQTSGNTCAVFDCGNGWWRFTATITKTNTNAGFFVGLWSGSQNYAGDGTSGLFIWGAQVNPTPVLGGVTGSLSTYYPTTASAYYGPRLDYDPATLAAQGLLIEEQRTNSIRNNTMQGAVAGAPGTLPTNWGGTGSPANGLTRQVVGTGTESGITYIDIRYSGTTTSTSFHALNEEPIGAIAALSGQTWTHTVYISVVGGSMANINAFDVGINEYSSVPAYLVGSSVSITPSAGALVGKRFAVVRTLTNASTASIHPFILFTYNSGVAIDITLRIGLPQLEQGAFATSVIPTTTTALTRNQDRAVINTLAPWYNSAAGTIYAEFAVTQPAAGANQFLARFSDNSYNNQIGDFINTTGFVGISTASGGVFDGLAATAVIVSANTITKAAGAYATNDLAAVKDGGAVATDNTATIPSGLIRFDLGSDHGGLNNIKAGYLRRITYYPVRLTNAALQQITT